MTINFLGAELQYGRSAASSMPAVERSAYLSAAIVEANNPMTADLDLPDDWRPGFGYVTSVDVTITDSLGNQLALQWWEGLGASWTVDGVPTTNITQPVRLLPTDGAGRQMGLYQLTFGDDVRTAILALAGTVTGCTAHVSYRLPQYVYGPWSTPYAFGSFFEAPPGNVPGNQNSAAIQCSSWKTALLNGALSRSSARYNIAPVGAPASYLNGCSFAAIDACGYVIVEPSEIGSGASRIPTNVLDNTPERFNAHPNTFFRTTSYVNGIAANWADPIDIASPNLGNPIAIYSNDSTLQNTRWVLVHDGQQKIVQLRYSGPAIYTPKQLWNEVLAPAIDGSNAAGRLLEFNENISLNKLGYITYARMISRHGTLVVQDNTGGGA